MLADRYVRMDFTSQEDFEQNYTLRIPDRFNFAYDIVDEYARLCPEKPAMIWTNVAGEERRFSFGDMSRKSNQAANFFRSLGLKKGDPVLLVLKRRYEYWFCALALMKLGCILIPATAQLAKKDIVYRCEAASIKAVITVYLDEVCQHVEAARPECSTLEHCITLGERPGWLNLEAEMDRQPEEFVKPAEADLPTNDDLMLMYFTSGTTGMPKMAVHTYTYPLAQIATAAYWHNLDDDLPAHCRGGHRLGQGGLGQDLWPVDLRRLPVRVRF